MWVSLISHKKTFRTNFLSFQTILLLLYPISKSVIFPPFFKYCWNVLFLDFILHLISSFINGGSMSLIVTTLLLTKFEKILNSVSLSIFGYFSTFALENNLFQSVMFNPIQDGWKQKGPSYQFFPCNFYKRWN